MGMSARAEGRVTGHWTSHLKTESVSRWRREERNLQKWDWQDMMAYCVGGGEPSRMCQKHRMWIQEAGYTSYYYERNAEGLSDVCVTGVLALPSAFPYSCQLLIMLLQSKKCYFMLTFNLDFHYKLRKCQSSVLGKPERTEIHWAEKYKTWRIMAELFWEVLKPLPLCELSLPGTMHLEVLGRRRLGFTFMAIFLIRIVMSCSCPPYTIAICYSHNEPFEIVTCFNVFLQSASSKSIATL